ncbi:hypothetical protein [Saccharothrix syringae]|uniref:Uncharacterized protein n=1 Tax=Saccharothrix syringae TaxID=103733 RepID=A0A5Q0H6X7_SACSY|nr:hypothetical protein [Saccharothrix syringae]QFZ21655.1 hypothetical protein EKG83_33475 [Saccharothrix syringae]
MAVGWRLSLVCASALVAVSACGGGQDAGGSGEGAVRTLVVTPAPTTGTGPEAEVGRPGEPRTGPGRAEVGVAYPFDLYAHCGVRHALFGGRAWEVEQPVVDPPGEPLARGSVNYLPGTAELVGPDRLRFTADADAPVLPGAVVLFRPTADSPPPCM